MTEEEKKKQFSGSAVGVGTHTAGQEDIKAMMNANSIAWHSAATRQEKDALHARNQLLAARLGGSVAYDADTGTWSGTADQRQDPVRVPDQTAGQAEDFSGYLQQMYQARQEASLAKLKQAYEDNLAAIERSGAGIGEQYETARNAAAGAAEQTRRNFNEYAAAAGLNNGTAGQAELSRQVALQSDLGKLYTEQADTLADLELQRTRAETEYNSAAAQAQAQGEYDLAAALYEEKVRVQKALLERESQQRQAALEEYKLRYQARRDAVKDSQYDRELAYQTQKDAADDRQKAAELALQQQKQTDSLAQSRTETLAEQGRACLKLGVMPSAEMREALGMSYAAARQYIAAIESLKS